MGADVARIIRDARAQCGLTQDQLAELMFVSRQTISNWETGRNEPDIETMKRLHALLHIDEPAVQPAAGDRAVRKRAVVIAAAVLMLLMIAVVAFALITQPRRASELTPAWFQAA